MGEYNSEDYYSETNSSQNSGSSQNSKNYTLPDLLIDTFDFEYYIRHAV